MPDTTPDDDAPEPAPVESPMPNEDILAAAEAFEMPSIEDRVAVLEKLAGIRRE